MADMKHARPPLQHVHLQHVPATHLQVHLLHVYIHELWLHVLKLTDFRSKTLIRLLLLPPQAFPTMSPQTRLYETGSTPRVPLKCSGSYQL